MPRFVGTGVVQFHYVPDIANPEAPTLAEIQAGDDLTGFLITFDTPLEGSSVDAADASSRYNKTASGTFGGQPATAEFYRDQTAANDTAWNLLPRGTTGYYVISRRGGSGADGALAVGDRVDVLAIDVITRNPTAHARNELERFSVSAAVTDAPSEDVLIV